MSGSVEDRERFPKLAEDIGEDPARILDRPLTDDPRENLTTITARIQGIDDPGTLSAYLAIERRLDRGPRRSVIDLLEDRQQELDENNESARVSSRSSRETPEKRVVFLDEDGEPRDSRSTFYSSIIIPPEKIEHSGES